MNFAWIIAGAFAFLLSLLGIERAKVNRKDKTIQKQKEEIKEVEKKKDIEHAKGEAVFEHAEKRIEIKEEAHKKEKEIEKAKTTDDTIDIANELIDKFNKL